MNSNPFSNLQKCPLRLINPSQVPISAISPFSNTIITFEFLIVSILCVMLIKISKNKHRRLLIFLLTNYSKWQLLPPKEQLQKNQISYLQTSYFFRNVFFANQNEVLILNFNQRVQFNSIDQMKTKDQKNNDNILKTISKQTLQQLLTKLSKVCNQQNYSKLFYNYELILKIAQNIINDLIPFATQKIITNQLLQQLTQQYSISAILYAIIIKAFQYPSTLINHKLQEKHRYFISDMPSEPSILLQSFIDILNKKAKKDKEYALTILNNIKERVNQSITQIRRDPTSITLYQQTTENNLLCYKAKIIVSKAKEVNYQTDDLIYSNNSTFFDQLNEKRVFYKELYKEMEKRFGQLAAVKIVQQALFIFGSATYIQTANLQKKKINAEHSNHGFSMQMSFYSQIADLNNFSIAISFIQSLPQTNQSIIELKIIINSEVINSISIQQFNQRQRTLNNGLISQNITSKYISVQNLIYQFDKSNKLGKGSYGSVFKCESLQLISQCLTKNERSYCFKRKILAAKQLTLTAQEQRFLQIPCNREHLILSMIKQLRHKESIKNIKRQLGLNVERNLIGIDCIVPMIQYFKISENIEKNQKNQKKSKDDEFYLIFQYAQSSLSNPQFLTNVSKQEPYLSKLFTIFSKIFQGLACLHFQINDLYPHELNRYFIYQNNDNKNRQKDDQQSLIPFNKNGIIHRDMKPSNIIVNFTQRQDIADVYLIDFGMAKIDDLSIKSGTTNCGSSYYMSPQVRNGMRQNQKIDVWSVGVFMYQMYGRNQIKLYNSVEVHSMNVVNDRIGEHINILVKSNNDKWSKLMKCVLNPKIELKSDMKGQIRMNSMKIFQFMNREEAYLRRIEFIQQFNAFYQGGIIYKFEEGSQKNQDREIVIQVRKQVNYIEQYHFNQFSLRKYLKNGANSTRGCIKYALISLYHTLGMNRQINLIQLRKIMSQLQFLSIDASQNSKKQSKQIVVVKGQLQNINLQTIYDVSLIKDLQQTILFAQVNNKEGKLRKFVVIAKDIVVKQFQSNLLENYSNNSIQYFVGYTIQPNSSKVLQKIYYIDEDKPNESILATQYNGQNRLFVTMAMSNQYDIFILNKINAFLPISKLQIKDLVKIGNKIINFIQLQTQKYEIQVTFEEINEVNECQYFDHFLRFRYTNDSLIIKFNKKIIKDFLGESSQAYKNPMKEIISKLTKISHVNFSYSHKLSLCLYIKSSSFDQYRQLSHKFANFDSPLKIQDDFRQLLGGFCYIKSLLTKITPIIVKNTIIKMIKTVDQMRNIFKQKFVDTSKSYEMKAIALKSKQKNKGQIEYLKNRFLSLPKLLKDNFKDLSNGHFDYISSLGLHIVENIEILNIFHESSSTDYIQT